jgi:hypothetical protein
VFSSLSVFWLHLKLLVHLFTSLRFSALASLFFEISSLLSVIGIISNFVKHHCLTPFYVLWDDRPNANLALSLCALARPSLSGTRTFFLIEKITAVVLTFPTAVAIVALFDTPNAKRVRLKKQCLILKI